MAIIGVHAGRPALPLRSLLKVSTAQMVALYSYFEQNDRDRNVPDPKDRDRNVPEPNNRDQNDLDPKRGIYWKHKPLGGHKSMSSTGHKYPS